MADPRDTPSSAEPPSSAGGDPSASRRRLLQGGLAAAPVLMTLVSRPVLAGQCTTPSGFVSLNASTAGRGVNCSGHTPSYWVSNTSSWPAGYKANEPHATRFNDIFSPPLSGNPTLLTVLGFPNTGSQTNDVARNVAATLLNLGPPSLVPVLSIPALKDIWSEFGNTGSFSPSSGAHWNASEIIAYLSTTMES